ncbi:MAG: hypothetical protein ABSH29_22870 [Acidimicrobiales bacterium]|jgi:hypothetical protein
MYPTSFTLHFGDGAKRTIELAQGTDLTDVVSMLGDARRTGRSVTLQMVDGESRAPYTVDGPSIQAISYVISSGDVLHSFLEAPSGDGGGLIRDQPEDRTCEL